MKKYICIFSLFIFLFLVTGCEKENKKEIKNYKKQITSNNIEENKEAEELLYGKYPEPILIAIGENNDVEKDYKELTKYDLKKIKYFAFEYEYDHNKAFINKKYGFEENKEYDFSILLEMPNLTHLNIDFESSSIRLKDYSIIKKLDKLQKLTISNINDEDVKNNIATLNSLTELSIIRSSITKLDFLESLNNLELFTLSYVPNITSYEALKCLNNIKSLNLLNSNMTDKEFDTIPNINTLTGLGLVGNNLTCIKNFPEMSNLSSLCLADNPIKSIYIPLGKLPKIRFLNIENTQISDVNKIKGLDSIEEVYIKGTKIVKATPFKKYKNLKLIIADLNNIQDEDKFKDTNIWITETY